MKYRSSGSLIRNRLGRAKSLEDRVLTHVHPLGIPGLVTVGIFASNAKGTIMVDTDTVILEEGLEKLRKGMKVYFYRQPNNPNGHLIIGSVED